jgi:ABC-type nickel/cobalt efflux system permease component RcnA
MKRMAARATLIAVFVLLVVPSLASAHPLGNFTINHYGRIVIGSEQITLDWVLDMAEIPAFSELRGLDLNRDGEAGEAETSAWLRANVPALTAQLSLRLDGKLTPWLVTGQHLTFPAGQGGLSTLRLEIELRAAVPPGDHDATFADETYAERIGWREVIVQPESGVRLNASDVPTTDLTDELRHYTPDAVAAPLNVSGATFSFGPGFATDGSGIDAARSLDSPARSRRPDDPLAALVGGDLSLLSGGLAVLLAIGLGAIHGISPGHGKTLVASYLIGSRGTLPQAIWLGVTVALSHTIGVFILGAVTLAATAAVLPERVIQWLTLGSALLIIGLGGSLLLQQLRGRRAHHHDDPHTHPHPHAHDHAADLPTLSTRGVAALGLVGGMVPSASALLVLLVAFTLHRLVFGVVLVVAFGLGMAAVLAGISASVVVMRGRLAAGRVGWLRRPMVGRVGAALPLGSALLVLAIGIALTLGAAANLA